MIIESPNTRYEVGKKVAETDTYRLYLCKQADSGKEYLLQIAGDVAKNGTLDFSSYVLGKLRDSAAEVEAEYAKVKDNPKHFLNYNLSFPALVESFIYKEQGDRRINILEFKGVSNVRSVVPLHGLVHRDRLRVDVRTSIWIMGKLLKTAAFVHDAGIAITDLGLGNILIEPDQHYVIIFNWANAQLMKDGVPQSTVREEIRKMARSVIEVTGGSVEDGIPNDGSDGEIAYCNFLIELATHGASNAFAAHEEFYGFVDQIWERGFHHFTTLPLR